jgi:hypothetical protein
MYLVFNVFYFYSGVGRAHLPPPLCYALACTVADTEF